MTEIKSKMKEKYPVISGFTYMFHCIVISLEIFNLALQLPTFSLAPLSIFG
jgi:hypothetical protein